MDTEVFFDCYGRTVTFDVIEKDGAPVDRYNVVGFGADFTLEWPHPWPREQALYSIESLAPAQPTEA